MSRCSLPGKVRGGRAMLVCGIVAAAAMFLSGELSLTAAEIRGRILDAETGAPLIGATVTIPLLRRTASSNIHGEYVLSDIPAGRHTVVFGSIGFLADTLIVDVPASVGVVEFDVRLRVDLSEATSVEVVAQRSGESEAAARHTEQNSPTVMNVLSGEAIERSTDASAAEAVQRIPGIAVTRTRGEARDAVIRGMEARYNNTLVDGVRIPSPATNTRVVQMDFLPSDLVQRIEVTKVLTPDMDGDAIGGTVNLVMREAPSEPMLRVRLGTGYSAFFLNRDYIGFRTDSIFSDPLERFGRGYQVRPSDFPRENARFTYSTPLPDYSIDITAGTRLINGRLGLLLGGSLQNTHQLSEVVRNYEALDPDNQPYYTHREYRVHSHSKSKSGVNLKADYILGSRSILSASLVAMFRQNWESRFLSDTSFTFAPILYTKERTVYQQHTIFTSGLSGEHSLERLRLKWGAGWAVAEQYKPDRAELTTSNAMIGDSIVSERYFHAFDHDWQRNTDKELHGTIDLSLPLGVEGKNRIAFGLLGRSMARDNYTNFYRLIPIPDSITGQIPRYTGLDDLTWEVANAEGTPNYARNNYTASEQIGAGYLMTDATIGRWHLLGGIRVEGTEAEYSTLDVNLLSEVSASKSYVDVLPSAHVRYALDSTSNLRLSLGRSISRPSYFDLVPYNYVRGELREQGNPALRRTIATNLDLRYEVFPTFENLRQVSIGLFGKWIVDPVETTLDLGNPSLPTLIPRNLGTAINYGIELSAGIRLIDVLTLFGNYTYTHSTITSDKIRFNKSLGITERLSETRSLQGQAEHVANLSMLFKDTAIGTTAQLSFVFTGRRVARVSPFHGLDHIQTGFPILDLSADKKFSRHITLFLKLTNLLDSPFETRLNNGLLIEREEFGQRLEVGLSYRLD